MRIIVAWRTATLSIFGQFMPGKLRSAASASLIGLLGGALVGFGIQDGATRLSAIETVNGFPPTGAQNGAEAKLLTVLITAAFFSWLLVEFLPRSDWISVYLISHEMRTSSRLVVAFTRIAILGSIAGLVCGPTIIVSIGGAIGTDAPKTALMILAAGMLGVCWARLHHTVWRRIWAHRGRVPGLGAAATEVSAAIAVFAAGIPLLAWPRSPRPRESLLWEAWDGHWLEWLVILSIAAVVVIEVMSPPTVAGVSRMRTSMAEWAPGGPFPVFRLVWRMVFRSREFRQVFGEAIAVAFVGLAILQMIAYSQRSLVAGHTTIVIAAAVGSVPLIAGRVIGSRPHLVCLAVSDRAVEWQAAAVIVCTGVPVMLAWGIGAGAMAHWPMALAVSLALWAGAVGLGSLWWLRWIDGRRLSKAALMGGACAVYGAEVLMAMAFGTAGLSEGAVAWGVFGCGVVVLCAVTALRGLEAVTRKAPSGPQAAVRGWRS
ncbi:MAG: hypothetical protein LBK59_09640 [Bifidobacteriaceae bacterium]|nr:hypothetical protein [Bifidobacteriaceae bacterium]